MVIRNQVADPLSIDLNRIWDRLYMGNAARGTGSGLGLPIVKRLAEIIQADVKADLTEDIFSVKISFTSAYP